MTYQAVVIDDNPSNVDALVQLLNRENIQAHTALSIREIPALLDSITHVDVVFLDLEFPNGNGLELIGALKQHELLQQVPFVAYSVHISELNEVMQAGFHSFVGKPLDVEHFPNQIQKILKGVPVWDANQ